MQIAAGRVIDRYVVDGVLGKGGMATVFRARHTALGTKHALKVLHGASPAIRARLLQEGRVQANLRHPCVVSVTDVIDVDGAPGLVMELVRGPSLDRWLAAERPTLAQIDLLALDILDGIAAAHRVGLVHRDIKPGNVMLTVEDGRVRAKITDFGLAKVLEGEASGAVHTRSGSTLGTPAYMAPEQIRDAASVDARADVYALGALLYELACGKRAYPGDDLLALFDRIRRTDYAPLSDVDPALPPRMGKAVQRALLGDPAERWPDVTALRDAWTGGGEIRADAAAFPTGLSERVLAMAPAMPESVPGPSSPGQLSPETFDTSTFPHTPTWTESVAPAPAPTSAPSPPPPTAPNAKDVPWNWGRAAVVGGLCVTMCAALAGGAWLLFGRSTRPDVAGVHGVPELPGASPAIDTAWQEGWAALLATDFNVARRRLERVTTEVDDARVWGALTVACGATSDFECVRSAIGRAATQRMGPDQELAALGLAMSEDATNAAPFVAYLDAHPDDLLVAIAAQDVQRTNLYERIARFDGPDAPPLVAYVMATQVFAQHVSAEDGLAALDRALVAHPDTPSLHAMRGQIFLEVGRFHDAKVALRQALDADPGQTWVWPAYGAAVRMDGDVEASDRITAQATAPEQPLGSRLLYWRQMAVVEVGRGHRWEAMRLLDEADKAAIAAGAWSAVLDVRDDQVRYAELFEGDSGPLLDSFREAANAPEVPTVLREKVAANLIAMDGEQAARRGEIDVAQAALERATRVGASKRRLLALTREIAIAKRDLVGLDAAAYPEPDAECGTPILEGLDRVRAGAPAAALPWFDKGLSAEIWCPPWGVPSAYRVRAYAARAEHYASIGDLDAARRDLAEVRRRWPEPDGDLPVIGRLSALEPPPEAFTLPPE